MATLEILAPEGPDIWWVADNQNTMVWTCDADPPAQAYQLLIANGNPKVLVVPTAIAANVANADGSHTITAQQACLTPAQNYTLLLADNLNQTKVSSFPVCLWTYLTHQRHVAARRFLTFEAKAPGSSFPASSTTTTESSATAPSTAKTGSAASIDASSSFSSSTDRA